MTKRYTVTDDGQLIFRTGLNPYLICSKTPLGFKFNALGETSIALHEVELRIIEDWCSDCLPTTHGEILAYKCVADESRIEVSKLHQLLDSISTPLWTAVVDQARRYGKDRIEALAAYIYYTNHMWHNPVNGNSCWDALMDGDEMLSTEEIQAVKEAVEEAQRYIETNP